MNVATGLMLVTAGLGAGFANTLASSGSTITLPLLIFLGIPPDIANGTNRLSIFTGALARIIVFERAGLIPWKKSLSLAIPTCIGTAIGALWASLLRSQVIDWAITIAVGIALIMLLTHSKDLLKSESQHRNTPIWKTCLVFFAVGLWTGFLVVDSGTYTLLALILIVGYDLSQAIVVKGVLLLCTSILALGIFDLGGDIDWSVGMLLALGSTVGSWMAAKIAMKPWIKVWIYRMLIFIVVVELSQLIWRML